MLQELKKNANIALQKLRSYTCPPGGMAGGAQLVICLSDPFTGSSGR